ncbi:DUF4276 family protein [Methanogenium sp. MK-MG]|uniref:DUF4276 family protein n=1 Tax=Methanogenium sp. MK-MG TaxID=2599926 RepID=UPI0013EB4A03|nr:DUF4276 family protein [Methanogenium sp. MK-MG]KAF1078133.1 hypothetical protein MKMG_00939 [Methanogenium sp. MK-MG]
MIQTLVFFLEEPSAREMLKGVLPSIIPDEIQVRYIEFQGKQDLEKQLVKKLRGWKTPDTFFVIMRDQDNGNCMEIKQNLLQKCRDAHQDNTLVWIACTELETFYLGDLLAVEQGLNIPGLSKKQHDRKFQNPDQLMSPSEDLRKITKDKYQKMSGSRAIGPHLRSDGSNLSCSFNVLMRGIRDIF